MSGTPRMATAFSTIWTALTAADLARVAKVSITSELLVINPRPEATADEGLDLYLALTALCPGGVSVSEVGRIALGQVDGVPIVITSRHFTLDLVGVTP